MANKTDSSQDALLMKQFDEMKTKHPDAILLFRRDDSYETYKQDSTKVKEILGLESKTREIAGKPTEVVSFPHYSLDIYLPKLVRAGMRVAICEQLEDPKQKKVEKENKETLSNSTDMARKKKKEAPVQEQPKAKAEAKAEVKPEAQQEKKPREPQMVTVNGGKVTHGHAFQSNQNPQDWFFTAKIDGVQLKPQKMDPVDVAAYQKKELTVPQLMERYFPTKLMEKVPTEAYRFPNAITTAKGVETIEKFNVYKEKNETSPDFGKYKLYAQVGDQKVSGVASQKDLNAFFDRVATPAQLVERNFAGRLNIPAAYERHTLPEGVDKKSVRISKDRNDGLWKVSVDLGERGRTTKQPLTFDDGYALFKTKAATREQIAAKYVGNEVRTLISNPISQKTERSASVKI